MSTPSKKTNRAKMLVLIGAILMLVSFTFEIPTGALIGTSPLTFDFDTTTSPWALSKYGTGSSATFTWINDNPSDPHVRLTCTSYDPTGWVGAKYQFDSDALTVGSSYTVTFWYLSTISFNMQYISQDSSYHDVDHVWVSCPASGTWVQKTLNIPSIQDAEYFILTLNVYTVGLVNFDLVQISLDSTATPTPAPIPTDTPIDQPNPEPSTIIPEEPTPTPINPDEPTPTPTTAPIIPQMSGNMTYLDAMLWIGMGLVGIGLVDFLLVNKKLS